jgi:hypothetical protein
MGKTLPITDNQEATASALELTEHFREENDCVTYAKNRFTVVQSVAYHTD